jgi:hypothetical protein
MIPVFGDAHDAPTRIGGDSIAGASLVPVCCVREGPTTSNYIPFRFARRIVRRRNMIATSLSFSNV